MNLLRATALILLMLLIGYVPSQWLVPALSSGSTAGLKVGSKAFTENVILAELVRLGAKANDIEVFHQAEIQGTQIVFQYLVNRSLDIYPEYLGTIRYEILQDPTIVTADDVRQALRKRFGIIMSQPLCFANTYALGMLESRAAELGIRRISDLVDHPDLRYSLSQEFVEREDGWGKMSAAYGIQVPRPNGNDHALTYKQLEAGAADVIDLYSTDSKIQTLNIRVLEDDLSFFPDYAAVLLFREELQDNAPGLVNVIRSLEGKISNPQMVQLNARCEVDGLSEAEVAAEFWTRQMGQPVRAEDSSVVMNILRNTIEHLDLVRMSLVSCILVAIPLGVIAARNRWIGQAVLGTIGVLQTIPGIALLVMLIAPVEWLGGRLLGRDGLGASVVPVIVALFIYSLLPIVRNTYTGLSTIPGTLRESADALGMDAWSRFSRIEFPLALPSILSGIKTAAVINVGFACLGAMIGGGGYGQPIFSGVRLSDTGLILQGAVPAAVMALLVQGLFEVIEKSCVSRGLKI